MERLCLHIGLPKTATSSLQRDVFPQLAGTAALSRDTVTDGTAEGQALALASHYLVSDGMSFPAQRLRNAAFWAQPTVLFSNELVSLVPEHHWQSWLIYDQPLPEKVVLNAKRLAQDLDVAVKVLVTVRRQDTWLASRVAESGKHWPGLSQRSFEIYIKKVTQAGMDAPLIRWLSYGYLSEILFATFGAANVLFLPMEQYAAEPAASRAAVARFITGDPDTPVPAGDDAARPNQQQKRPDVWGVKGGAGGEIALTQALSRAVLGHFRGTNQALAQRTGLPLAGYGYVPSQA